MYTQQQQYQHDQQKEILTTQQQPITTKSCNPRSSLSFDIYIYLNSLPPLFLLSFYFFFIVLVTQNLPRYIPVAIARTTHDHPFRALLPPPRDKEKRTRKDITHPACYKRSTLLSTLSTFFDILPLFLLRSTIHDRIYRLLISTDTNTSAHNSPPR